MSTEYIERGSKIEALMQHMRKLGADKPEASQEAKVMAFLDFYVIRELENTPAADVEPVVRAKWEREFKEVPVKDGSRCVMKVLYKCAGEYGCKEYSIINSKRCPKCGAHMDERSEGK